MPLQHIACRVPGPHPVFRSNKYIISKPETVQIQTLQHVQVALVPEVLTRDGTVYGNRQIIRVRRGAHQVLAVACLVRFKPKKSGSIKNTEYVAVTLEGKALDVPWTEVEDHHVSVSDLSEPMPSPTTCSRAIVQQFLRFGISRRSQPQLVQRPIGVKRKRD